MPKRLTLPSPVVNPYIPGAVHRDRALLDSDPRRTPRQYGVGKWASSQMNQRVDYGDGI